jgi:hypothetical protein
MVGALGDPSARECLGPLERKPAWNLLGFAPKLLASGISRLGLDSSTVDVSGSRYEGMIGATIGFSGEGIAGEELYF